MIENKPISLAITTIETSYMIRKNPKLPNKLILLYQMLRYISSDELQF